MSWLIKGTIIGFDLEKWKTDPETLASWLFCAMETWSMENFSTQGDFLTDFPNDVRKKYGEVKAAVSAFYNDIHSLSIALHQMNYILSDEKIEGGLKTLYIGNLVENYITNIRTIYDLLAIFPRIAASHGNLKLRSVSTDNLNSLLKGIEDKQEWAVSIFTEPVVNVLKAMRPSLTIIREIRNAIIHDGKEPIVSIKSGVAYFRIPKSSRNYNESLLPDLLNLKTLDFPLFPYLQTITGMLWGHMDNLGKVLINNAHEKDNSYMCELTVLGGICIPDFMAFINKNYSEIAKPIIED